MVFTDEKMQIVLAAVYFIYQICAFFILGSNLTKWMPLKRDNSVPITIICGYFVYYTFFECLALPMKIMGRALSELALSWLIVICCILVISIITNRTFLKSSLGSLKQELWNEKRSFFAFMVLIVVNFIMMLSLTPETMGVQDDSYYIADAVTSLFTDAIQQYHYATGELLSQYNMAYFIPMYPIHGAVIGRLLHLHPVIENKWSSVLVVLVLSELVYYLLAQKLYKGERKKSLQLLYLMTFFHINYVLWGKASGTFFYYRISEGKGILSNLILPALIMYFWEAIELGKKANWCALEFVILGGISICMSSSFLLPVALAGLMVGVIVKEKSIKRVISFLMLQFTCLCVLIVYELLVRGIIFIPIR